MSIELKKKQKEAEIREERIKKQISQRFILAFFSRFLLSSSF
jgi:hypothetical protein